MVPTTNSGPPDPAAVDTEFVQGYRTAAVLDRLRGRTGPVSLSELAAEVAAHEATARDRREAAPAADVERVRIRLHHVDLPALDDAGLLHYDHAAHLVAPGDRRSREKAIHDVAFELLAHRYRRTALDVLCRHRSMRLPDLAAEVARREGVPAGDDRPVEAETAVYHALYHVHVPKLCRAGVVEVDRDRERVTATGNADRLRAVWRYADRTSANERESFPSR